MRVTGTDLVISFARQEQDDSDRDRAFLVHTAAYGVNNGKVYFLRAHNPEVAEFWIHTAMEAQIIFSL